MLAKVKQFKFDSEFVLKRIEAKERRVLSGTGAFARKVMRNKIRPAPKKKKGASKYPRYHGSSREGLRFILFHYSPSTGSVVVGPVGFNTPQDFIKVRGGRQRTSSRKKVPELLNEGGVATRTTHYLSGTIIRTTMNYRPQPFSTDTMPDATKKFRELMEKEAL